MSVARLNAAVLSAPALWQGLFSEGLLSYAGVGSFLLAHLTPTIRSHVHIVRDDERRNPPRSVSNPVLWYMETTGTGVRPRRLAVVGDVLYVQPRYRWTSDDERQPNEGVVEIFSLRDMFGEVVDDLPLEDSPLRDLPELEDVGDYRYWDRQSPLDIWDWR